MKRVMHTAIVSVIAAQVLVIGQGNDATRVLTGLRQALGGAEKLLSVKTLSAEGTITRSMPDGTSRASRVEFAFELPDKYLKKDVVGMVNGTALTRTSGFNGDALIEATDLPPQLGGGQVMVRPGSFAGMPGGPISPEQAQQARVVALQSSKREFTRLMLGMVGSGFTAYPVEFTYAGLAESPDGKADVLEVRHADGFVAKLFVEATTHMPLMLSWMDKEPLVMAPMTITSGRATVTTSGASGTQTVRGSGPPMSQEEIDRMIREQRERVKEAEANRKVVEYRMFYADYKAVDGIKLPMRIQRMIAGQPVDEIGLERIRVNPKLDDKTFTPTASK
jgi:hypothetical protein